MSTNEPIEGGIEAGREQTGEQLSNTGKGRRRFARNAGMGATGVLFTLASQSGMAAAVCKSPSRKMSTTMASAQAKEVVQCSGIGPEAWSATSRWPCSKDTTTFGHCFSCGGSSYATLLVKDILTSTSTDLMPAFNKAISTAYLNVTSNRISFLTLESLTSMYTEVQSNRQYKVTATQTMSITELTDYLNSTFDGA